MTRFLIRRTDTGEIVARTWGAVNARQWRIDMSWVLGVECDIEQVAA